MRVAIVTETFVPRMDGIVRMLLEYLRYLRAHGHDAIVFAAGAGPTEVHGFPVERVWGVPFPPYPQLILSPYSRRMARVLRAWRPDVMHLAGPFVLGVHGLRVARALGVPAAGHYQTDLARYAAHYHAGALAGLTWRRLVAIHNACALNFAPTDSIAAELRAHGMQRVHVCGRGVDGVLFHPGRRDPALRARVTGGQDGPIFVYVGRVSAEKNLDLLLQVARTLPAYPLLIVGDGPARSGLMAQARGLNIHFTGALSGETLAAAYASGDVFLFPSATETFGQVVREAMASGLPVVGVRAGGVADLVRDGETGVLCAPNAPAEFIAAARRLVEDAALRRRMGEESYREAQAYTWDGVFDELMGWYAGLVAPTVKWRVAGGRG